MHVEIPDINRCCCCVPARYGLLMWASIRLILSLMLMFPIIVLNVIFYQYLGGPLTVMLSLAALLLLLDIAMNIMALIGGHLKRTKLLQSYYTYSLFSLVLFSIIFVLLVIFNLSSVGNYEFWFYLAWFAWVGFGSLFVQIYMLLLLRSKLKKLESNCKFRFVNHAAEAEAECVLEISRALRWNPFDSSEDIDDGKDNAEQTENVVEVNENIIEVSRNRLKNNDERDYCNQNEEVNPDYNEIVTLRLSAPMYQPFWNRAV